MAIEAVVFDMDGLMLDTEPLYKVAWQSGCRELGFELTDTTYSTLVGRPTPACEQVLLQAFGAGFPLELFRSRWPAIWQDTVAKDGIRQKRGLEHLLDFLRSRGLPVAVATSSEANFTAFSLSRAGLSGAFETVVTGDQVERGKPAPDIYLAAAARLGVAPQRCIALEDSEAGTVAACTAGMITLLVPDWVPPSPAARQAATAVFPSLVEAGAFIETRLLAEASAGYRQRWRWASQTPVMTRVAIIGNAGGGKSTLAAALGRALGLPVHHIDRIQFQPGWQLSPPELVAREHERILTSSRWIIDGWGGWPLIQKRLEAADTVVVIDFPLWRHLWWALKRQIAHPFGNTSDRPENCPLLPMTWQMLRAIWNVHRSLRPELLRRVGALERACLVIILRSPRELAAFARKHCTLGDA